MRKTGGQGFFMIELMFAFVLFVGVVGIIASGYGQIVAEHHTATQRLKAVSLAANFLEQVSSGHRNLVAHSGEDIYEEMILSYQWSQDPVPMLQGYEPLRHFKHLEVTVTWPSHSAHTPSVTLITCLEKNIAASTA